MSGNNLISQRHNPQLLDTRPASVLHVRLQLLFRSQQPPQFPARKAAPFVTEQTTRLVLPSHIESVADAAAAVSDFAKGCGLDEQAAFGVDMALREAVTNAVVHGNQEYETKSVEVILNCSQDALEIEIQD